MSAARRPMSEEAKRKISESMRRARAEGRHVGRRRKASGIGTGARNLRRDEEILKQPDAERPTCTRCDRPLPVAAIRLRDGFCSSRCSKLFHGVPVKEGARPPSREACSSYLNHPLEARATRLGLARLALSDELRRRENAPLDRLGERLDGIRAEKRTSSSLAVSSRDA
jgi:hypothetical protein